LNQRLPWGFYAIGKDGTVFLPGETFARDAFLCASYDGEPVIYADRETMLFRADWLKETYPRQAAIIDSILARIQEITKRVPYIVEKRR